MTQREKPPDESAACVHVLDVDAPEYRQLVVELKKRVQAARVAASGVVNRELILLYWDIGRAIVERQSRLGWGKAVVEMVSRDLRDAFPGMTGFSPRNVWDMRRLYAAYAEPGFLPAVHSRMDNQVQSPDLRQAVAELTDTGNGEPPAKLRQLVAEIPWGQNLLILNKIEKPLARLWYLLATARMGWSRNVLLNQIKASAYERAVVEKKSHNFPLALPEQLAEQAAEAMKSRYNLEFLGIAEVIRERELEDRLISDLQAFLLELGYGFCFVGRQYRLTLGRKEYFVDLLFYHRFLKALVAFELKVGAFEPEFAGKMDFYLNLLNDTERGDDDNPSIGIILCAEKDDIEVEYALRTKQNPIGVAEYTLSKKLPAQMRGKLPTAKQLASVIRRALPDSEGKQS